MSQQSITTALAKQLAENYLADKRPSLGADETYSVFFPKDAILKTLGISGVKTSGDVTGIRFYFASYPADMPGFPEEEDYKGKLTLVAVRTTHGEGGIMKDDMSDPSAAPSYDFSEGEGNEMNYGSLVPPLEGDSSNYLVVA